MPPRIHIRFLKTIKPGASRGDVWHSKDGVNWTELTSGHIWSKRHEHAAFVFRDKIWVAGGAAEPNYQLDSEVWSLQLPTNWHPDK